MATVVYERNQDDAVFGNLLSVFQLLSAQRNEQARLDLAGKEQAANEKYQSDILAQRGEVAQMEAADRQRMYDLQEKQNARMAEIAAIGAQADVERAKAANEEMKLRNRIAMFVPAEQQAKLIQMDAEAKLADVQMQGLKLQNDNLAMMNKANQDSITKTGMSLPILQKKMDQKQEFVKDWLTSRAKLLTTMKPSEINDFDKTMINIGMLLKLIDEEDVKKLTPQQPAKKPNLLQRILGSGNLAPSGSSSAPTNFTEGFEAINRNMRW